jgi:hypothetical protein
MESLETLCQSATDGVADWLTAKDPTETEHLQRFVHDILTTNPDTHAPLPPIYIFLIELALGCVDWDALARDPRFRHLDWAKARITYP